MMESQNLGPDSQLPDTSHPISDGVRVKVVEGPVDVVAVDGGVMVELGSGRGGKGEEVVKRKRGRPPKVQVKVPPAKKNKEEEEEEDVCFICFDGGSLVLCDRRGCPKAYHPACIKRDEAFFESAAKWDCGWHICSICQKSAHHMCYTCTYSLCRSCIRKADYVCVRGDKGFCTICMKTIMLIENNGQGEDGKVQADFDDKLSWEYLFKVYWVYLKRKLSLTLDELTLAKNPWKEASTISSPLVVQNIADNPRSITSSASLDNLEANESKRRKIDDGEIEMLPNETVNMEKQGNEENTTLIEPKEWATKELLDFVAHMKDGNTSVLSRFDVQALVTEYINRNDLSDPRKKNQIICDSRLKNLFGKPRVGRIQMLKLLEPHFFVGEDLRKRKVRSIEEQDDADWNPNNRLTVGKSRKPRNRSRGEERTPRNKLDEFAAVDVHNMNLIYLRRDLMEVLLDDDANFHGKVVGSIVRIRISCSDQEHDMYRLVKVVGTSKVDEPYKVNSKLTGVMLEVLNLDKKETISIDAISDQEFSEEECRRLQQSIKCGLVKHFTVGDIQEKAVALQSVKLNDWIEKETLRLDHLHDIAGEKGHKKGYRECMEKLQLLKTPEERDRRLQEIPEVHSDPKMNPNYESDDTEEYFNKEHGDHMESKYSGISNKNPRSLKKRAGSTNDAGSRSRKNAQPKNTSITKNQKVEEGFTKDATRIYFEKDSLVSTSGKSQNEVECNASTITKVDHQPTLSSSVTNSAPEVIATFPPTSTPDEMMWHYLDPNGKVQGPFSLALLQRWSTTGYFPADMKIWKKQEDKSLLLTDVLKEQFGNYDVHRSENIAADNKAGNQTEGHIVCSAVPSSTDAATPYAPNLINHEKASNGHDSSVQFFGQNWSATNNLNSNPPSVVSLTTSNELTGQLKASNIPKEMERNEADVRHLPTASKDASAPLFNLPGPAPKIIHEDDEKMQSVLDSKLLIQDSGNNPPSWSSASSLVVGGPKFPVAAEGWGGCSSTPVKREEWDSGIVSVSSFKPLEVAGDHVATPTSNIDQNIQPTCNDLPTWQGMSEMIEFSTLAEESVSDLLAEVDAMESQYGLPSPTSRRNSFVDDLFNDDFSPTPDQGTRSDGFSSSGDIQLPCHSTTTTTDEHINPLDFMETSNGLQQHSLICPDVNAQIKPSCAIGIPQRENTQNVAFEWPDMEKIPQGMIDINSIARAEGDEGEMETKTSDVQVKVKVEDGNYIQPVAPPLDTSHDKAIGVVQTGELKSSVGPLQTLKSACAKLVTKVAQGTGLDGTTNHRKAGGVLSKEEDGEYIQPQAPQPQPQPQPRKPPLPPPPLTLGLDPFEPHELGSETMQNKLNHSVKAGQGTNTSGNIGWDLDLGPNQDLNGNQNQNQNQNQHRYGGVRERHNTRSHRQVEDSGGRGRNSRSSLNNKQSSPTGGGGCGGGGSRPPSKGQRICRFNESGRCRKGASCKYLHQ